MNITNTEILWLMGWYHTHCDESWQEMYGIRLETTENARWHLIVSVLETELEDIPLNKPSATKSANPDCYCYLDEGIFHGYCSNSELMNLLKIFREWADPYLAHKINIQFSNDSNLAFPWLLDWYQACCSSKIPSQGLIKIATLENPGWTIDINLENTPLSAKNFDKVFIDRSDADWISCYVKNNYFIGCTGPFNFFECIDTFKSWVED